MQVFQPDVDWVILNNRQSRFVSLEVVLYKTGYRSMVSPNHAAITYYVRTANQISRPIPAPTTCYVRTANQKASADYLQHSISVH